MKHFKRIAYLLSFSIVMSALLPVSVCLAEPPRPESPAVLLHNLGIMQGPNPKAFQPELNVPVTKGTGAVMLVKSLGYAAEAQAMPPQEISAQLRHFKDSAEVPHWAAGYIAEAVKQKLIQGNSNGFLEPDTQLTCQTYYKMLLNALGYEQGTDFTWSEVNTFAASKGLGKDTAKKVFTMSDLAASTVDALNIKSKDSGKTLIERLVDKNVIPEDVAVASGLFVKPPDAVLQPVAQNNTNTPSSPSSAPSSPSSPSNPSNPGGPIGPVVSAPPVSLTILTYPATSGAKGVSQLDLSGLSDFNKTLYLTAYDGENQSIHTCDLVNLTSGSCVNAIYQEFSTPDYGFLNNLYEITTGSSFILFTAKTEQTVNPDNLVNITIALGNQSAHSETISPGASPTYKSTRLIVTKVPNRSGQITLKINEQSKSYDIALADTASIVAEKIASTFTLNGYNVTFEGNSVFFTQKEPVELSNLNITLE